MRSKGKDTKKHTREDISMGISSNDEFMINQYKEDLLSEIRKNKYLIVIGDTGSGKTTQIPQYLLDEKHGVNGVNLYNKIIVTQPRRVAAVSAARWVADKRNVELGSSEIGYSIRFEKECSPYTRLTYTTDGLLLRELMSEPQLVGVDVVIIDEAHERGLQTDLLIGILRQLTQTQRPNLKVIIMSATLEHKKFSNFFDDCPVYVIPGRQYPVEVHWLENSKIEETKSVYVSLCVECVFHIHNNEGEGSILVFLTGHADIQQAMYELWQLINEKSVTGEMSKTKLLVLPMISTMEMRQQRQIFELAPPGYRKVIISTNIAQTSITIPDVVYIVDSGFVKQKIYVPSTGMNALVVMPISQTASTQRAGRAGRTASGKAYRLYSQEDYDKMEKTSKPQILTSSLTGTILLLKQIGIQNILDFPLIDPPNSEFVIASVKKLYLLGALSSSGKLTKTGKLMNFFALSPLLSKTIVIAALEFGYLSSIIDIISLLSFDNLFVFSSNNDRKPIKDAYAEFKHESGDHMTLLNIINTWKKYGYSKEWCKQHYLNYQTLSTSRKISQQLSETCISVFGACDNTPKIYSLSKTESILKSFCAGFYHNTARNLRGSKVYYHYITSLKTKTVKPSEPSPDTPANNGYNFPNSHNDTGLLVMFIHPESVMHTGRLHEIQFTHDPDLDWLLYNELTYNKKPMMRTVSKIKYKWVEPYINLPLQDIDYTLMSQGLFQKSFKTSHDDKVYDEKTDDKVVVEEDAKPSMESLVNEAKLRYESRKRRKLR